MSRARQEYRMRLASIEDLHRRARGEADVIPASATVYRLPPRAPADPVARREAQARRWSAWKKTTTFFASAPADWWLGLTLFVLCVVGGAPFLALLGE